MIVNKDGLLSTLQPEGNQEARPSLFMSPLLPAPTHFFLLYHFWGEISFLLNAALLNNQKKMLQQILLMGVKSCGVHQSTLKSGPIH